MKKLVLFISIASLLSLASCSPTSMVKLNGTNYLVGSLKSKKLETMGFVAGRLKFSCNGTKTLWISTCDDLNWTLTAFDSQDKFAGFINSEQSLDKAEGARRFNDAEGDGTYFCFPMPPDKYNVRGFGVGYPKSVSYALKEDSYMKIPFEVKPGEISYIGEIHYQVSTKALDFLSSSLKNGSLKLADAKGDFADAAKTHCPGKISSWPMVLRPLDADANGGHPLVRNRN